MVACGLLLMFSTAGGSLFNAREGPLDTAQRLGAAAEMHAHLCMLQAHQVVLRTRLVPTCMHLSLSPISDASVAAIGLLLSLLLPVMTGSQLLVILLILILGFWKSDRANMTPFLPYGVEG
jgi:hypothetical protein